MNGNAKVYFPSLNGLRFIAAFVVIIHHLEQIKLFYGLPSLFFRVPFFKIVGELGVTLFFVLSGFLITYLLLAEKERFKTIDVKKFYVRRILRIWPLYYLVITLGLFVFPHIHFFDIPQYTDQVHYKFGVKILLYYLLLPNVVNNLYPYMPYIAQAWSIGIEEQFYYVWPWIIKFTKNHLRVLFIILFGLIILTNVLFHFADHSADLSQASTKTKIIALAYKIFSYLRIGCMAIGGIGAYYLYHLRLKVLNVIFSPFTQLISLVILIELLAFGVEIPYINHEFYSLFFIVIILNLAANPKAYFSLENKFLDYLGKISYSLYMWHSVALMIAFRIATTLNPQLNNLVSNAVYYIVTFLLSIFLASASYELFEMKFLKFKHLFAKVQSGNLSNESTPKPTKDKTANTVSLNKLNLPHEATSTNP